MDLSTRYNILLEIWNFYLYFIFIYIYIYSPSPPSLWGSCVTVLLLIISREKSQIFSLKSKFYYIFNPLMPRVTKIKF